MVENNNIKPAPPKPCLSNIVSKSKQKTTAYEKCPLKDRPCIEPKILEHKEVVFIAEAPDYEEAFLKEYMVGESGKKLRGILSSIGINPDKYTILNSVICHPDKNETPSKTIIKLCSSNLKKYIEQIKPKTVVLLGNPAIYAWNLLYGTKIKNVSEARGSIIKTNGINVLCTFHPAYILRNRGTAIEQLWMGDLYHLFNLINNNMKESNYNKIIVDSQEKLKEAFDYLSQQKLIAVDIETTGLDYNCRIICVSMAGNSRAFCFFIEDEFTIPKIKELLENPKIEKIGHNLKFDYLHLKKLDIEVQNIKDDTMLLHFLKSGMATKGDIKHGLDKVGWEFGCPIQIPTIDYSLMETMPKEQLAEYAMADVLVTEWVYYKMKSVPTPTPTYKEFVENMSEKLTKISTMFACIEEKGIKFDLEALNNLKLETETNIKQTEKELFDFVEHPFNLKSSKQVTEVINKYGVPIKERTEKKQYISTEVEVLERYKEYPIIQKFLNARKPKDDFIYFIQPAFLKLNNTSIYHPTFNLHTTRTGRTSSGSGKKSINLQNINPQFRPIIIPKLGKFLEFDYSQIEFRVMGWLSKDKNLLEVFEKDVDIHKYNASIFFNKKIEDITPEERYFAKQKGFKTFYGGGAKTLAIELNCPIEEAENKMRAITFAYGGLKRWGETQFSIAKNYGYSIIPSGRLRIFTKLEMENSFELRKLCFNTPPQGYASDITLFHAYRLFVWLRENKCVSHIVNLVHDSILLDCEESELSFVLENAKEILTNGENLIPKKLLKIEYKVLDKWE